MFPNQQFCQLMARLELKFFCHQGDAKSRFNSKCFPIISCRMIPKRKRITFLEIAMIEPGQLLKKTFTLSITSYTLGQTITSKLRCHGRSCILQWMFHLIWESMVLAAAGIAAAWSRATTRLPRSTGTRRSSPTCCGSPAGKLTSKLLHGGADANLLVWARFMPFTLLV